MIKILTNYKIKPGTKNPAIPGALRDTADSYVKFLSDYYVLYDSSSYGWIVSIVPFSSILSFVYFTHLSCVTPPDNSQS